MAGYDNEATVGRMKIRLEKHIYDLNIYLLGTGLMKLIQLIA